VLKYFSSKRKKAIDSYEKYLEQFALETDNEKKAKVYADYVMGSEIFVKIIKLMFKDKKLPEEIKERKILRKIYVPEQMNIKTCEYY
jgi:heme oxygenase